MSYSRKGQLKNGRGYNRSQKAPSDLSMANPFSTTSSSGFIPPFGNNSEVVHQHLGPANVYQSPYLDRSRSLVRESEATIQSKMADDNQIHGLQYPYPCFCGKCIVHVGAMGGSPGICESNYTIQAPFGNHSSFYSAAVAINMAPNTSFPSDIEQLPAYSHGKSPTHLQPGEVNTSTKQPPGKRWPCPLNCGELFTRKADAQRHTTRHASNCEEARPFLCWIEGCKYKKKGFARKDKLKSHMKKVHPNFEEPEIEVSDRFVFEYYNPSFNSGHLPQTPSYGSQSAPSMSPSGSQSTHSMSSFTEISYGSPPESQIYSNRNYEKASTRPDWHSHGSI